MEVPWSPVSKVFTVNPNYEVKVKEVTDGGVYMDTSKFFLVGVAQQICNKLGKWAGFIAHIPVV